MRNRGIELWIALGLIVVITLVYFGVVFVLKGIPGASSIFGHGMGIVGFILMLFTETLYSIRKRQWRASWGAMSTWLQFHIITGLVGPYMVLLHTSWKYNGLAGLTMLLTLVIVASGFIGRYIYTKIPRTAVGLEMTSGEVDSQLSRLDQGVQQYVGQQRLDRETTCKLSELHRQRQRLQRQKDSLAAARRLMATWHAIHIPIGAALFTAAFVHIAATIYFVYLAG